MFSAFANFVHNSALLKLAKAAKTERKLPEFLPVIFANGEDDDTDGVISFLEGRAVLLPCGERLESGRPAILANKILRLRYQIAVVVGDNVHVRVFGSPVLDGRIPTRIARPNIKLMRSLYEISVVIQLPEQKP